jgi:hypothetical protein
MQHKSRLHHNTITGFTAEHNYESLLPSEVAKLHEYQLHSAISAGNKRDDQCRIAAIRLRRARVDRNFISLVLCKLHRACSIDRSLISVDLRRQPRVGSARNSVSDGPPELERAARDARGSADGRQRRYAAPSCCGKACTRLFYGGREFRKQPRQPCVFQLSECLFKCWQCCTTECYARRAGRGGDGWQGRPSQGDSGKGPCKCRRQRRCGSGPRLCPARVLRLWPIGLCELRVLILLVLVVVVLFGLSLGLSFGLWLAASA